MSTLVAVGCNTAPSKENFKAQYVKGCITEAKKMAVAGTSDEALEKYCNCAGDKLVNTLTAEELKKFEINPNDPAVASKHIEIITPCVNELSKSMTPQ